MRSIVPAAVAAAIVLSCSAARADEPAPDPSALPAPERRYPPSSVRWKLISGGLFVLGGAYAGGTACATQWPDVPGADVLKIPVAGPWIALGQSGCAPDDPDCGAKVVGRGFLYVLSGLAQLGGLGLIGEGIFMTTESRPAKAAPRKATGGITVQPFPVVTASLSGVGFVGSF